MVLHICKYTLYLGKMNKYNFLFVNKLKKHTQVKKIKLKKDHIINFVHMHIIFFYWLESTCYKLLFFLQSAELNLKKHICAAVVIGYGNFSKVGDNNIDTYATAIVIALSSFSGRLLKAKKNDSSRNSWKSNREKSNIINIKSFWIWGTPILLSLTVWP